MFPPPHEIVIDRTFVALFCVGGWCFTLTFLSTTFTVKVYVSMSCLLGVPEMTPVDFFRWRPFGSLLVAMNHLYGRLPPLAASGALYRV